MSETSTSNAVPFALATVIAFAGAGTPLRGQEQSVRAVTGQAGAAKELSAASMVNQATGAVTYSVPISSITEGQLTVPISATYASQGHRLQDKGGVIGLGWSLNVGGSVTRQVRGIPDDAEGGKWSEDYDNSDPGKALAGERDSEYDVFYYTAGQHFGSFYYDGEEVKQIPETDCRIEPRTISRTGTLGLPLGWTITTPEGVAYRFGGTRFDRETRTRRPLSVMALNEFSKTWAISIPDRSTAVPRTTTPSKYLLSEVTDMNGARIIYDYAPTHHRESVFPVRAYTYIGEADDVCLTEAGCSVTASGHLARGEYVLKLVGIRGASGGEAISVEWRDFDGGLDQQLVETISKNVGPNGTNVRFEYEAFRSERPSSLYSPINRKSPVQHARVIDKPMLRRIVPHGAWPSTGHASLPHYAFAYHASSGLAYPYPLYRSREGVVSYNAVTWHDYAGFAAGLNLYYGFPEVTIGGRTYGQGDRDPDPAEAKKTLLRSVSTPQGAEVSFDYEPNTRSVYRAQTIYRERECPAGASGACGDCTPDGSWARFTLNETNAVGSELKLWMESPSNRATTYVSLRKAGSRSARVRSFSMPTSPGGRTQVMDLVAFVRQRFGDDFSYGDYEVCLSVTPPPSSPGGGGGPKTPGGGDDDDPTGPIAIEAHGDPGPVVVGDQGEDSPALTSRSATAQAGSWSRARLWVTTPAWRRNEIVPGLRVSGITVDDRVGAPHTTTFGYHRTGAGATHESSGVTRGQPRNIEVAYGQVKFSSENFASLAYSSGSHILYGTLTTASAGSGKTVQHFRVPEFAYEDEYAPRAAAPVYTPGEGVPLRTEAFAEGASRPYQVTEYEYESSGGNTYGELNWQVDYDPRRRARTAGYRHPRVTRARVRSVRQTVDGRETFTQYEYDPDLKGAYPTYVETQLPDGTSSYRRTSYTHGYHRSTALREAMLAANYVGVPYNSYHGKDGRFHERRENRYSFYTTSGYPTSSDQGGPLAVRYVYHRVKAATETGDDVEDYGPKARYETVVSEVHPDGTPRKAKRYSADRWTVTTKAQPYSPLVTREVTGDYQTDYVYVDRRLRSTTSPRGLTVEYEYDNQNRVERVTDLCSGGYRKTDYFPAEPSANRLASVRQTSRARSTASAETSWTTLDGVGRVVQAVATGRSASSPTAGANGSGYLLNRTEYDGFGRVVKQWDPHTVQGAYTGGGRTLAPIPSSARWTATSYERSPRGRIESTTANNGYSTRYDYGYSLSTVTTGGYPAAFAPGQLATVRVVDHEGYVSETYRDAWGNTVRTERYAGGASVSGVFDEVTYGYDVKNQLMRVVPGDENRGAVAMHYRYLYDGYGNLREKVVPAEGTTRYVYSIKDQLDAVQTPHTRTLAAGEHSWVYLYDVYGNRVRTGLVAGAPRSRGSLGAGELVGESTYAHGSAHRQTLRFGRLERERTRMLDGDREWLVTEFEFESGGCGRAEGSTESLSGSLAVSGIVDRTTAYDPEGRVEASSSYYGFPRGAIATTVGMTYTADGVVDMVDYRLNVSGRTLFDAPAQQFEYTAHGDLAYERTDKSSGTWLQQRDYAYDPIGRLTQINQPLYAGSHESHAHTLYSGSGSAMRINGPRDLHWLRPTSGERNLDLFFEQIRYDSRISGGVETDVVHHNLIQETVKATQGRRPVVETYGYDSQLRLKAYAAHELSTAGQTYVLSGPKLHASATFEYDELSRPREIERYGWITPPWRSYPSYVRFDDLDFEYRSHDPRVRKIRDRSYNSHGHKDNSTTSGYSIDAAGRVTYDGFKGLRFRYNAHGLTERVERAWGVGAGTASTFRYDAAGVLRESKDFDASGALVRHVYHVDGHRYDEVTGEVYMSSPSGATLVDPSGGATHVGYHVDHLGNVVLAYADLDGDGVVRVAQGEVLEESRYYPYGMKVAGYGAGRADLPFAYNGAEEDERFGLHLTTFRTMAPETGLWSQVDPKAEAMYGMSPYTVNAANPISASDPHGDIPFFIFPHVSFGSGGVSIGLEVGVGVPGVASASVTVGGGSGGAYASVQGTFKGTYAGYSTQGGGFAGVGIPIGGAYIGAGYSEAGGFGVSGGVGGAPGSAQASIGVGWSQRGGFGASATVGAQYTGADLKARFGQAGSTATASTDTDTGFGPEWDWNFNGIMELEEAMWWYRHGGGREVDWALSDVDLSDVYYQDIENTEIGGKKAVNLLTRGSRDGSVLGSITLKRVGPSQVRAFSGMYDFEMHSWWNPLNWGRNMETLGARAIHGSGTPFWINHPGTVRLGNRPPPAMPVHAPRRW